MKRLNNKGFAITGILYTLFILFLLILISVLSGLSSKRRITDYALSELENSYKGIILDSVDVENARNTNLAPDTGKYIFKANSDLIANEMTCISYLEKGTPLNSEDITYIPKDCNEYELNFTLTAIYSFEDR